MAPWGSSQVQWDAILGRFDQAELADMPGVIDMHTLLNVAKEVCSELPEAVSTEYSLLVCLCMLALMRSCMYCVGAGSHAVQAIT